MPINEDTPSRENPRFYYAKASNGLNATVIQVPAGNWDEARERFRRYLEAQSPPSIGRMRNFSYRLDEASIRACHEGCAIPPGCTQGQEDECACTAYTGTDPATAQVQETPREVCEALGILVTKGQELRRFAMEHGIPIEDAHTPEDRT